MSQVGIIPDGMDSYLTREKVKYGSSLYTSTYVPYLGMTLQGDHAKSYFGMPDAKMYYARYALATMNAEKKVSDNAFRASHADHGEEYQRMSYKLIPKRSYEFVAALKRELWLQNKQRKAQEEFIANAGSSPYAMINAGGNPYVASVPAGGNDSAAQVVGPLTQIPFIQDVLGFPTPNYVINELTTKVALPQLHAEQPETDYGAPNLQLEPTQFVENRRPDVESHFYHARRNEYAFILPREYRYRATIDPYNIYVRQASDGLRAARDALTLLALSKLKNINGGGGLVEVGEDIPNPATNITNGFPAAENNVKVFFSKLFAKYWEATRKEIDCAVVHPTTFLKYESNFYSNGFKGYEDAGEWGLVQFPGFKNKIKTAVSPFCPEDEYYFFNKEYVLTGEGPTVTETWAKPEANADAGAYRDYVDITIFNAQRAGFKAKVAGSNPTEITSLEAARNLIKPPKNLLNTP